MATLRYVRVFAILSALFPEYFAYFAQFQCLVTGVTLLQATLGPMQNKEQEVSCSQ